eukprot:2455725-Rhodomonas_salina.2
MPIDKLAPPDAAVPPTKTSSEIAFQAPLTVPPALYPPHPAVFQPPPVFPSLAMPPLPPMNSNPHAFYGADLHWQGSRQRCAVVNIGTINGLTVSTVRQCASPQTNRGCIASIHRHRPIGADATAYGALH